MSPDAVARHRLLILVSCALTSCGGDEQQSAEQPIRAVLQEALTSKDEGVCTRLFTQRFVEQRVVLRGDAAVRVCRDDYEPLATSVAIESVRVNGPRARADVRPKGGTWTFKTASIGLRKAGGRWQLDRLKGGTLDRAALSARLRNGPRSASDELPDGVHNCLLRVLRTSDDEELVRAIVGPDVRVFLLPSVICGLGPALYARGVPSSVRACVARRMRRALTSGLVERRLAADHGDVRVLGELNRDFESRILPKALQSCAFG